MYWANDGSVKGKGELIVKEGDIVGRVELLSMRNHRMDILKYNYSLPMDREEDGEMLSSMAAAMGWMV